MIGLIAALLAVVSASNNTVSYSCDGSTAAFTVNFPYLMQTDLVVKSTTAGGVVTTLTPVTDFSLSVTSTTSTATITLTSPSTKCPSGSTLNITRTLNVTQPQSFRQQTKFDPSTVEAALDRRAMVEQQLQALYTNPPATVLPANIVAKLNGIRFADQFANIQAAITDAGTTGTVLIPTNYSATDTFVNTNAIPIIDLRNGAGIISGWRTADEFGAVGDGTTDDAGRLQTALNSLPATGGVLVLRPGKNYKILTQLSITKPNVRIIGYGAKITQAGTLQRGFTITAANVTVEGVYLFNANGATEWNPVGGSTNARGIFFDAGSDGGRALNNKLENWGWSGITVFQSARALISGNEVIGVGAAAGLVTGSNNNLGIELYLNGAGFGGARIINNTVRDTAQGIFAGDNWENLVIANNTLSNIIGQHCMYLDSLRNAVIANNSCTGMGQNGIKLQIEAATPAPPGGDGINISVTGNTIKSALGAGIIVLPAQAGLSPYFYDIAITDNSVTDCGIGIDLDHAESWVIANNVVRNSAQMGIHTRSETHGGRITGNYIANSQQSGMVVQQVAGFTTVVEGNSIDSPCLSGAGTVDQRAITFLSTGTWIYKNNFAINTSACTSEVNGHASSFVKLGKNYFPGLSNNSIAGTVLDESTVFSAPTNGQTITPSCATTTHLFVTVGFAGWTAAAPINTDSTNLLAITVSNTSGGAIVTTWNAIYKMAAWVEPATGNQITITFRRSSSAVKWYEVSRSAAVPN